MRRLPGLLSVTRRRRHGGNGSTGAANRACPARLHLLVRGFPYCFMLWRS